MSWRVLEGDAAEQLAKLDAGSVQTCITSPPYWGLRDYGDAGQLGLEPTPEQCVANLVAVFCGVRRVLRDDGTLWLNLGDSYNTPKGTVGGGKNCEPRKPVQREWVAGLKPKDLVGIPWMVAFALRADGWWLRSDIVWAKPNPMPEPVTDRPTRSHEYIFLLTKSARYFYDADAIREDFLAREHVERYTGRYNGSVPDRVDNGASNLTSPHSGRNKRSVWTVATQPFPGAHFATFPPKLIEPCVLAGSPPKCCGECGAPWERVVEAPKYKPPLAEVGERFVDASRGDKTRKLSGADFNSLGPRQTLGWKATCYHADPSAPDDSGRSIVLDPFAGAGTTGVVALRHDRDFIGVELNPAYAEMARNRIRDDAPLFNVNAEVAA